MIDGQRMKLGEKQFVKLGKRLDFAGVSAPLNCLLKRPTEMPTGAQRGLMLVFICLHLRHD